MMTAKVLTWHAPADCSRHACQQPWHFLEPDDQSYARKSHYTCYCSFPGPGNLWENVNDLQALAMDGNMATLLFTSGIT